MATPKRRLQHFILTKLELNAEGVCHFRFVPIVLREVHHTTDGGVASGDIASYLGVVLDEPIIAPSAYKHGLSREDILHAYRNPLRIWDLGDGFTMMIGPNRAALILEVGYVEGDVAMVIVHAMPARDKYLR